MTKVCTKCGLRQTRTNFHKSAISPDGLKPRCKNCIRKWAAAYYLDNREQMLKQHAEYRDKNRDELRRKGVRSQRKYRNENPAKALIRGAKGRAKEKKLPFDLEEHMEEIEERVGVGLCEFSGLPLNLSMRPRDWDSLSIHRLVPSDGYVYSNIMIVCWAANQMIGTWGEATALMIMRACVNRRDGLDE